MNWLSHWDEDWKPSEKLEELKKVRNLYEPPTEEEIKILFGDSKLTVKMQKTIARIKICGGGLTFTITDDMEFEMPTEEQRENLKKTFGIEVELVEED